MIQPENIKDLLRSFTGVIDNYEDQCVSTEEMREMSAVPLFQSDIETWMSNAFRRLEVTIEEGKPTKAECLLGLIVSHYLTCSDDQSLGMPSAQFREQWLPIEIAISSCHIYTITGRISDAMSMLKVVQSLIERDASQIDRFDKSHRDTLAEKCTLLRRRSYDEDVPRIWRTKNTNDIRSSQLQRSTTNIGSSIFAILYFLSSLFCGGRGLRVSLCNDSETGLLWNPEYYCLARRLDTLVARRMCEYKGWLRFLIYLAKE